MSSNLQTNNESETLQAELFHYAGEEDDLFQFVLRTDGTGLMVDCQYGETVTLEHGIDLARYAKRKYIKLSRIDDFSKLNYMEAAEKEDDITETISKYGPELRDALADLFFSYNETLENPVGDPNEDDTEMKLDVGTDEELLGSLHAVAYLAQLRGWDSTFTFTTATQYDNHEINECPNKLEQIVNAILATFGPTMTTYEYVDENDGRVTAYAPSGSWYEIDAGNIETYFPSARERLEIKAYLREIFAKYDIDLDLLDTTFPAAA